MRRAVGIGFLLLSGAAASEVLAASEAQPLPPPAVIRPGDSAVDGSFIKPHGRHWKVTLANAKNQLIDYGDWSEDVDVKASGERRLLERRIRLTGADGKPKENVLLVVDAKTFAPIRTEEDRPDLSTWLKYRFDGRNLAGQRSPEEKGGSPRKIELTLATEPFDYLGGMMELFLAALPLKRGYAATFPAALATSAPDAPQDGIAWITARVKGEMTIEGWGGRKEPTWLVEADTPYGFYKVWVSRRSPYLIQAMLILPPGGRLSYQPAGQRE